MTRARLVGLGVVLVCIAGVVLVGLDRAEVEQDPDTVDRLRYTSVVVAPDAEDLLDADRARRIVGDRPIVVIAGNVGVTCDDVADTLTELIVLVVSVDPPLDDCGGNDSRWTPDLLRESVPDVGRDGTAYVAAYVRAFDARVEPGTPPPRREPPELDQDGDAARLVVLVVTITAAFLLVAGYLVRRLRSDDRDAGLLHRRWRARTNARLNQLADRIMHVDDPSRTPAERATIAKEYVLALRAFESATTDEQRGSVNHQLRMLETRAGITTKTIEARPRTVERREAKERRRGKRDRKG